MEPLPLPDMGDALHSIAGLSPAAQITALIAIACVVGLWVWTRRPQPGPDAALVVRALELTARAQAETAASMATVAQQVEAVAEDVRMVANDLRSLTRAVLAGRS